MTTAVYVTVTKLTVTEALAEIKTLQARIQKRRENIQPYLARQNAVTDPLLRDLEGGSPAFIKRERQAAHDLEERLVKLRTAIQRLNLNETITIGKDTRSIAEWLTWRKEILLDVRTPNTGTVYPGLRSFLAALRAALQKLRQEAKGRSVSVVSADTSQPPAYQDVVININEIQLAEEAEQLETIVGTLDGQLSLKNATTFIEV